MSAIAGVFALDGRPLSSTTSRDVEAMTRCMAHRGPPTRVMLDGALALATLEDQTPTGDLVAAADGLDPIRVADAYRKHGDALAHHLDGRFAFVLFDRARARIVLGRDALGVRPLFYARVDTAEGPRLVFGSELKALLSHPACPRELDWTSALVHEAMPRRRFEPTTFFRGLDVLPMGGTLIADFHGQVVVTARDPLDAAARDRDDDDGRDAATVIAGFRDVFVQAVDDALGPNPERCGLLLSGGIDSLAIAAVAARRASIPTFTVLGKSTWGNGDARLAHAATTSLGLDEHMVLFPVDTPMSPDAWRRLVWQSESPHAGPQHLYKLAAHRHAAHARPDLVRMLNGEGSDELMGADFRNHGEDRPDATFEDYLADLADKQRVDLHSLETLAIEHWLGRPVQSRRALARASGRAIADSPWSRRLSYVLPGLSQDVLWRDDRLASGHHLTADTPYLDRRLVDFVLRIPRRLHGELFWKKRMLRDAMIGLVPEALRTSPKTPFFAGVDARYTSSLLFDMLMADDRALVREALGDGDHPELEPGLVELLVADCAADPQRGAAQVLLTLVNLGLLDAMARDAGARPGPVMEIEPRPALGSWNEATIEAALRGDAAPPLGPDVVVALAPGVELVRRDQADLATPSWYIIVDDQVRYVLDEEDTRPWCEVLRRSDGRRRVGAVLEELGLDFGAIAKHLDEALAFGVVIVGRDPGGDQLSPQPSV